MSHHEQSRAGVHNPELNLSAAQTETYLKIIDRLTELPDVVLLNLNTKLKKELNITPKDFFDHGIDITFLGSRIIKKLIETELLKRNLSIEPLPETEINLPFNAPASPENKELNEACIRLKKFLNNYQTHNSEISKKAVFLTFSTVSLDLEYNNKALTIDFRLAENQITAYIENIADKANKKPGTTKALFVEAERTIQDAVNFLDTELPFIYETNYDSMEGWALTEGQEIFQWDGTHPSSTHKFSHTRTFVPQKMHNNPNRNT